MLHCSETSELPCQNASFIEGFHPLMGRNQVTGVISLCCINCFLPMNNIVDCGVDHYDSFEDLFRCNMRVECIDGRDEKNCSYRSKECGPDRIDAGSKCYKIFNKETMWLKAGEACKARGEELATFDSVEEFQILHMVFLELMDKTETVTNGT